MNNTSDNVIAFPQPEHRECPACGGECSLNFETQRFTYGRGREAVELEARVPIWRCGNCDGSFTDGAGEDARHEAVCRHLGVLTPQEIVGIRSRHGLTQAALAKLTGYGEASIKRWETGTLIQNTSADRFLRLIDDQRCLARLRLLESRQSSGDGVSSRIVNSKFSTKFSVDTLQAASSFQLSRTGAVELIHSG